VLEIDDYGRAINVLYDNDLHRSDDDFCVETHYASPTGQSERVLHAPVSRRIWDCTREGVLATWAAESWEYDNLPSGHVSNGYITAHTVERHVTDNGSLLNAVRTFDASYDIAGNPTIITSKREDGAVRTSTIQYDPFGLVRVGRQVTATGTPPLEEITERDPVSLDTLTAIDANMTQRGLDRDGFGRVVRLTFSPPGGALGVVSTITYLGFSGTDPLGRRLVATNYSDPIAPGDLGTAVGRTATVYFDELGRTRRTEVALGADYPNQILIVGMRNYDLVGRVAFEADPFPISQDPATAYGITHLFNADGTPSCFIRGRGPQAYSAVTDESVERYPTCFSRSFANHEETIGVMSSAALLSTSPQAGVTKYATRSAIGRVLNRSTWRAGTRLEYATFVYDRLGQRTAMTRYQDPVTPDNPVETSWRLDSLGQIIEWSDPEAATKYAKYSNWGELLEVEWMDTTATPNVDRLLITQYDALGRITYRDERNNGVTDPATVNEYLYDVGVSVTPQVSPTYVLGRVAQVRAPTGKIYFSYDPFGRVNARTFTGTNADTYVEKRTFRGDGVLSALDFYLPDTSFRDERVEYGYDSAARLRSIKFFDGQINKVLYDALDVDSFGRARKAQYGGIIDYEASYADLGRRLMNQARIRSPLESRDIIYLSYDPLGRELSRREIKNGAATGTDVAYDALGRLSMATKTEGVTKLFNWQYGYDALGNLVALNDLLGAADATLSLRTGDRDRVCRIGYGNSGLGGTACNVSYDSVGNVVAEPTRTGQRVFNYFDSGKVRSVADGTAGATFRYDALGSVQELDVVGTGVSDTRHDRRYGGLIERRDQIVNGTTTTFVSRNIPGPGGIVASRRGSGNDWVFLFGERRGNRFFIDGKGGFVQDTDYQPFGEARSSGVQPGSAQYTNAQWNDGDALAAFDLSHLGARLFDPVIGRFLSRDPLVVPRSAATTNAYAFAMNDPVNMSDPTGMDCIGQECVGPSPDNGIPGGGPSEINPPNIYQNLPWGGYRPGSQAAYRPPPQVCVLNAPQEPETSQVQTERGEGGNVLGSVEKGVEVTADATVVVEHFFEELPYLKWAGYGLHTLEVGMSLSEFVRDPSIETGHEAAFTIVDVGLTILEPIPGVVVGLGGKGMEQLGKYAQELNAQSIRNYQKLISVDKKLQSYLEKIAIERDVQSFYPTLTCSGEPVCRPSEDPSSQQAIDYLKSLGPNTNQGPKALAFERWMNTLGLTDQAEIYSSYPEFQSLYPESRASD
jgi:RHS repeat-associated protein